jgi:SAM-dependent methyltransferase
MQPDPERPKSLGADHAELEGSHEAYRYRPHRLSAGELAFRPVCRFRFNGSFTAAREVLDLSPTGVAIVPSERSSLRPGQIIEDLRLEHCNSEIWAGSAEVVYFSRDEERVGLRFTSGQLNMRSLGFRDDLIEQRLVSSLYQVRSDERLLPAEWRAGISTTRHLLEAAKGIMEEMERGEPRENWKRSARRKRELCEMVYHKWWPVYRDQLLAMDTLSQQLPLALRDTAMDYAAHELMPLLRECPMHSRAFDKPHGYAGDYLLMVQGNADELSGETLYGCLLQHTVQNFALGKAIVARCNTAGRAAAQTLRSDRTTRIVSLASGPAIELKTLLEVLPPLEQPVELILVDADEHAIQYAYESLSLAIQGREDGHLVRLSCLNFSIGQIMTPVDEDERKLVADVLENADLIYSMGLFDYLNQGVAVRLLRKLYELLAPEGRLFIGNLKRAKGCSWAMDFAVHWHLLYRTEADMLELGKRMREATASYEVTNDETGYCMFLDVKRNA